jgi:hypothetical protein
MLYTDHERRGSAGRGPLRDGARPSAFSIADDERRTNVATAVTAEILTSPASVIAAGLPA